MSQAQTLLEDQQGFITDLQVDSATMQFNAMNAVLQAKPGQVKYTPMNVPQPYKLTAPPEVPTFDPIDLDLPPDPEPMGELLGVTEPNSDAAPVFGEVAPVLEFGNQPNQLAPFQDAAPMIETNFGFPDAPADVPIVGPELLPVVAPIAPVKSPIEFNSVAPAIDAQAPQDLESRMQINYRTASHDTVKMVEGYMDEYMTRMYPEHAAQLSKIELQLSKYLEGGTGLTAEIEDAIYDRARAKNDVEAKRVQDAAFADNAARGFTLPSGALSSALARARQDAANNNAKQATDIAVMQAEMEQKNLQYAVTTSAALRKTAVDAMLSYMQGLNSINSMAVDYAKSILSAVVQVYDIQIKAFTLKLEAYKTAATVFEVKSRAAAQAVEIYKAEVQAMEGTTNVNKALVDIYKAQINAKQALNELYKTQVEATVSQASLEKLKIDLFQAQVQTYAAQVQAKSAEWQGYQARIGGEEAKSKVYSAQVAAYNSEVEAFKAKTDGISEQIKGQTARNNSVIQEYSARVNAYETDVRAKAAVANANIEGQRQVLTGYQGQVSYAVAQANLAVEAYKANVQATALNTKTDMESQVENVKSGLGQMNALTSIFGEILKIYSGPATAAAAGMNSLAAINFNE